MCPQGSRSFQIRDKWEMIFKEDYIEEEGASGASQVSLGS